MCVKMDTITVNMVNTYSFCGKILYFWFLHNNLYGTDKQFSKIEVKFLMKWNIKKSECCRNTCIGHLSVNPLTKWLYLVSQPVLHRPLQTEYQPIRCMHISIAYVPVCVMHNMNRAVEHDNVNWFHSPHPRFAKYAFV